MGEWNVFKISKFTWDIIQVYLKHGYGSCKLYDFIFFSSSLTDETVLMTLEEFANEAVDYDGIPWKDKSVD